MVLTLDRLGTQQTVYVLFIMGCYKRSIIGFIL